MEYILIGLGWLGQVYPGLSLAAAGIAVVIVFHRRRTRRLQGDLRSARHQLNAAQKALSEQAAVPEAAPRESTGVIVQRSADEIYKQLAGLMKGEALPKAVQDHLADMAASLERGFQAIAECKNSLIGIRQWQDAPAKEETPVDQSLLAEEPKPHKPAAAPAPSPAKSRLVRRRD
jgi:hypothetical protein